MHEGLKALVGTTVGAGRFRLDRVLGEGGMGAVFAGVEVATGREVAIKLMHPGLGEEDRAVRRFQREAEVTTRLRHPHVVEVISAGGGAGEPPFIVMELLGGASLSARLKEGEAFEAPRVIRIARQVLAAVSAGHRIGVIHRDLKPANVVIERDERGEEIAKVVDYGVARLAMTDAMTKLTRTGQVVGTPAYMAPEQAMGAPAEPTSDTYAVGAILHRVLAGEPPYGRGKYVDILKRMVADERTRIHERVKGLGRLADVIERAIAHDPAGRYQSADEMNDALAELDRKPHTTIVDWRPPADLDSLRLPPAEGDLTIPEAPVSASAPASSSPLTRRPASRRLSLVVGAGLLAALVGAGLTWIAFKEADAATIGDGAPRVDAGSPDRVSPIALGGVRDAHTDTTTGDAGDVAVSAAGDRPAEAHHAAPGARRVTLIMRDMVRRLPDGTRDLTGLDAVIRRQVSLEECWPAREPLPPDRRSTGFELFVESGRITRVRHLGENVYPEVDDCIIERVGQVTLTPSSYVVDGRYTFVMLIRPVDERPSVRGHRSMR